MADMLVKLYDLPELYPHLAKMREMGIEIRRARPSEVQRVADWVRKHFQETWAMETLVAVRHQPVKCYIAVEHQTTDPTEAGEDERSPYDQPPELLLGFAAYDVDAKGMFGPTGVREDYRSRGIGTALLLACLHAMRDEGYAYAAIGWAGPTTFYAKTVGATIIEGSAPGVFRGPLVGELPA